MNELIRITDHDGQRAVSARELHQFLGVQSIFTTWCYRMFGYGFEKGLDFFPILEESTGGRPSTDYALTLDTAKEISMLQRTEKGKQARQYFIECEKQLLAKNSLSSMSRFDLMRSVIDAMEENNKRINVVERKVQKVEAKVTNINTDYYALSGYYVLRGRRFDLTKVEAQQYGKKLTKASALNRHIVRKTYHEKYGSVNTYHTDVLKAVLGF